MIARSRPTREPRLFYQPSTPAINSFRKAGRYKLAAPVSKTGSVTTEVGALPTPSANFNHQPREPPYDNNSPAHTAVAAGQTPKARTAKVKDRQQEGPTGPANAAEADALSDLFPGRKSCGISCPVASIIRQPLSQRKEPPMKSIIRYRSQLRISFRGNYKPNRVIRIRPAQKATLVVRPARAGPQINIYEYTID